MSEEKKHPIKDFFSKLGYYIVLGIGCLLMAITVLGLVLSLLNVVFGITYPFRDLLNLIRSIFS